MRKLRLRGVAYIRFTSLVRGRAGFNPKAHALNLYMREMQSCVRIKQNNAHKWLANSLVHNTYNNTSNKGYDRFEI